ncbi:MAG: hypothetical protein Q4G65_11375 [bacterium]|nr:hypothetical protein [bacterium]
MADARRRRENGRCHARSPGQGHRLSGHRAERAGRPPLRRGGRHRAAVCRGDFGGGVTQTNGVATVSVAASGKITAKQPVAGKAVSFSATCFDAYDAEGDSFWATLTAKVGKEVVTNVMTVTVAESGMGFIAAERFDAWQYNWKVEPWKTIGKSFDKREMSYEEEGVRVTLKFSASGTAKVAGEFAKLDDEGNYVYNKYGVLQTVTATGSATLLPTLGEGGETRYIAFVYLAPKDLPAHARCVEVAAEVVE